jgi:hypothetical protein
VSAIAIFGRELADFEKLADICEVIDAKTTGVKFLETANVSTIDGFDAQGGSPAK